MLALLAAFAALQQPARRPSTPAAGPAAQAPAPRNAAFDSTSQMIIEVGKAVADVKSEVDRFRNAAYNDPGGTLLEYAAAVKTRCQALAAVARQGARVICRHCVGGGVQPAMEQYRAFLPTVSQLGARCAADVQRLRGRGDAAGADALRRGARSLSDNVVNGMRAYEAHIGPLVAALSGRPMTPAPRTSR